MSISSDFLYISVLYLVKTSDTSERTLQRRPLTVRLLIEQWPNLQNFLGIFVTSSYLLPMLNNLRFLKYFMDTDSP